MIARVDSEQACPGEATHVMTEDEAHLPVLCLKKLRPTLNDKIRSLGD